MMGLVKLIVFIIILGIIGLWRCKGGGGERGREEEKGGGKRGKRGRKGGVVVFVVGRGEGKEVLFCGLSFFFFFFFFFKWKFKVGFCLWVEVSFE